MLYLNYLDTQQAINDLIDEMFRSLEPPREFSTLEWSNTKRYLSPKNCARPGKFTTDLTPYLDEILDAVDDPNIPIIVCQKSAQVAWTDGVICNVLGKRIDCQDEGAIVIMFPREKSAKDFEQEKFKPMVEVTPSLHGKIEMRRGTKEGNTALRKSFGSGMIKLVGSNSPSEVKSTSAPITIVEEPDDSNENVQGQGNTIKLLQERSKSFENPKCVFGGTPTISGSSQVDEAFKNSDRRFFWVVCGDCGDSHVLSFNYFTCTNDDYETAKYNCPHCGSVWTDNQRINNIRISRDLKKSGHKKAGWIAETKFDGVAGFTLNELYSAFPGSRHTLLMKKWIDAKTKFNQGGQDSDSDLIAFTNSSMGISYEYPKDTPPIDDLKDRAEPYFELTIPKRAVLVSAGVDVQHDRLAIIVRAWGQGEESWLVYWGEIYGDTSVSIRDSEPVGVWKDLDDFLHKEINHELGYNSYIRVATIDSSDGKRTDAVYQYVRARSNKQGCVLLAGKGSSKDKNADTSITREIFTPAKPIDVRSDNKYAKMGVQVFIIGTSMAKDLILGTRVKLVGNGPGVMHHYQGVREDYYEQLLSEVKAPRRGYGKQKLWQRIVGVRNEGLDCEVYALHAARAMKIHLWTKRRWEQEFARLAKTTPIDASLLQEPQERPEFELKLKEDTGVAEQKPIVQVANKKQSLSNRLA